MTCREVIEEMRFVLLEDDPDCSIDNMFDVHMVPIVKMAIKNPKAHLDTVLTKPVTPPGHPLYLNKPTARVFFLRALS